MKIVNVFFPDWKLLPVEVNDKHDLGDRVRVMVDYGDGNDRLEVLPLHTIKFTSNANTEEDALNEFCEKLNNKIPGNVSMFLERDGSLFRGEVYYVIADTNDRAPDLVARLVEKYRPDEVGKLKEAIGKLTSANKKGNTILFDTANKLEQAKFELGKVKELKDNHLSIIKKYQSHWLIGKLIKWIKP